MLLGLFSAIGGGWSLAGAAPWGLVLLGWVGARAGRLWRRARAQRAVHAAASELQALVHDSKALTGVSRKALRLVQETEVISRGFTLYVPLGSTLCVCVCVRVRVCRPGACPGDFSPLLPLLHHIMQIIRNASTF